MLYVQQSLGPNEEIIHIGHFHWMYTFMAVLWVFIGLGMSLGLLWFGIYAEVSLEVNRQFVDLTAQAKGMAWDQVVEQKGGYIGIIKSLNPAFRIAAFAFFVMGLFMFAKMMVTKATTEICVTNDRLIFKQGLIAREVGEMSVDRIEGVNVFQGILGRLLDYGTVVVRGMGVGEVVLPPIEKPIVFRRAIEKAKTI